VRRDSRTLPCHSDRSRTLSEAEGDGGVEEPAVCVRHHDAGQPSALDSYQGIANTIVQLFLLHPSGVMRSLRSMPSEMRSRGLLRTGVHQVNPEGIKSAAKLRTTHEDVSSRTRRSFFN
jgi:hypothetical protein